ncbi:MAG: ATP synthase F1 subunit epsilon [Thermoanaerobaculia bacterium]|nr:MAG: ATP synthase F1 subunit epsilon [Thermoanaerobaculia bacterium]MBZ0102755.1 ATP synthase F1 subunit epsilon [Thermoanaerobaculia bacterium]
MAAGTFHLSVVTPEREVLAAEVKSVALPAYDGEMGILPRRAPLLVQLGAGELRLEEAGGGRRSLFVSGGFAQMIEDRLSVLTEEALEPGQLTAAGARDELEAARLLPAGADEAWKKKQRALDRARALGRKARG